MKHLVTIKRHDGVILYQGRLINLPMKSDAIKAKSIELFNDDDPCIIHQSYASAQFAEAFLEVFEHQSVANLDLKLYADRLDFIDIVDLANATLTLEVK